MGTGYLAQAFRRGDAAAGKDAAQQRALYQAARNTLAAEGMSAWLDLIARRHAIDIEQRRLDTLTRNAQFILQRYRNGLGSLEDLDSARTTAASSRAGPGIAGPAARLPARPARTTRVAL